MTTRREFITKMSAGLCCLALNVSCKKEPGSHKVRFGVISDVHQDLQSDAPRRLQAFIDASKDWNPDFIIQLGDLSHGEDFDTIRNVWEQFPGERYSVLGNHDMDHTPKEAMVKALGMPGKYYSYDFGGIHFVVLDLNYMREDGQFFDFDHGNYFRAKWGVDRDLISPEELEWLKTDLAKTDKPTVIFSHQGLDDVAKGYCPNREEVRALFRKINDKNAQKVIACFCGHNHVDAYSEIEGIHYFQINSASYYWTDAADHYSNGHMIEYKDALYAFVTIDLDSNRITVEGVKSEFLPPAPKPEDFKDADKVYPYVSDRMVDL